MNDKNNFNSANELVVRFRPIICNEFEQAMGDGYHRKINSDLAGFTWQWQEVGEKVR